MADKAPWIRYTGAPFNILEFVWDGGVLHVWDDKAESGFLSVVWYPEGNLNRSRSRACSPEELDYWVNLYLELNHGPSN